MYGSTPPSPRPQVYWVRFKDGFQVTWNFLESFQLSNFNEMQSIVTWDFTYLGLHTGIFD